METHARTIMKSVTWRVGGFAITVGTAWLITGRMGVAASIGALDTLFKLGAFYVHERLWLKIGFGRKSRPDYEI